MSSKEDKPDKNVLRKYDILARIGKGAYGIVWRAKDKKTNQVVAIKKIFDAFQNSTDAQRTYREVMFLRRMDHENIVTLLNCFRAENDIDFYLVFEFMETDLYAAIRAGILEDIHKQYVLYQLVKALKYLHSGGLVHRDIKPNNILLNSQCLAKVCDFGLARYVEASAKGSAALTDYVATRWYRAPEILVGSTSYSAAVDMWAVGCILGELYTGRAIFPGQSTLDQIQRIVTQIGTPSIEDIDSLDSQFAESMISTLKKCEPTDWKKSFPKVGSDGLDLMAKLIRFNPNKRLTATEALAHPYFSQFHDVNDEPSCDEPLKLDIDHEDERKLKMADYRQRLYDELTRTKRPAKP